MSQFRIVPVLGALAFSLFAVAAAHASTVDVSVDVTPISGGLFQYDYTIADGTGELFDLDIAVTPGAMITGSTAPGAIGQPVHSTPPTMLFSAWCRSFRTKACLLLRRNLGSFSTVSPVPAPPLS
jgi:hypothetical protein